MKSLSKKGVLLFAGVMAVCAFALPAVSSAASWGAVGSNHTLVSTSLSFTSASAGGQTTQCTNASLPANVTSAAVLTITAATVTGCTTTVPAFGSDCTTTVTGGNLPWTATAPTTNTIQIHNITLHVSYEHMPGRPGSCAVLNGLLHVLTGTLTGGVWNGNGSTQHGIVFTNAPGLTMHPGNTPVATSGTLTDAAQTLTLLPFP